MHLEAVFGVAGLWFLVGLAAQAAAGGEAAGEPADPAAGEVLKDLHLLD